MINEHRAPHRLTRRSLLASAMAMAGGGTLSRHGLAADEPTATDILNHASQRLAEVESMHFTLEVDGVTYIDPSGTIQLVSAVGDLARPDKVAVEFKVSLFGTGNVSIKMITVGEQSWTTDLITGNWGDAPPEFGYNPSILYDNQDGLGPVMGKLDAPEMAGEEKIAGRQSHHVRGTASAAVIGPVTAGTMTGDNVGVELWIDKETFDLLQVKLTEPDSDDKDDPATWTLKLSKFNEKVTIDSPE